MSPPLIGRWVCLFAWWTVFASWAAADVAGRPNVIFLLTDDQRVDTLGCMGNPVIETPHLDALAGEGVTFTNAFVTTAICMTNRACILTGQYAARHGIEEFNLDFTPEQLADTYLGRLKAAGYRTGFIGKWGVGHPRSADPVLDFNRGFPGQHQYFPDLKNKKGQHLTSELGDDALEFIDGCEPGVPFHLSLSFKAPHCQDSQQVSADHFPPDPAFADLYRDVTIPPPPTAAAEYFDRLPGFLQDSESRTRWAIRFRSPPRYQESVKNYYRLITGVDAVVGRVRAALEEKGLADNTVIIFSSDHGFYLGDYGLAGKWYPHEVSIRVPLIVHDPRPAAAEARGTRPEAMALSIDLAPTILAYAGLEAPARMQGVSLVPIAEGTTPDDWRTAFFYEHHFTAGGRIPPSEGVRTERWKYARYLGDDGTSARYEEVYDLVADPNETTNLALLPGGEGTLADLRGEWGRWRESVRSD